MPRTNSRPDASVSQVACTVLRFQKVKAALMIRAAMATAYPMASLRGASQFVASGLMMDLVPSESYCYPLDFIKRTLIARSVIERCSLGQFAACVLPVAAG